MGGFYFSLQKDINFPELNCSTQMYYGDRLLLASLSAKEQGQANPILTPCWRTSEKPPIGRRIKLRPLQDLPFFNSSMNVELGGGGILIQKKGSSPLLNVSKNMDFCGGGILIRTPYSVWEDYGHGGPISQAGWKYPGLYRTSADTGNHPFAT